MTFDEFQIFFDALVLYAFILIALYWPRNR